MKRLSLHHTTRYEFQQPVRLGPHTLLIRPRVGHDVRIESSTLDISPQPAHIRWQRDLYGNSLARVAFADADTTSLQITSEVTLQQFDIEEPGLEISDNAQWWPFQYDSGERLDLVSFMTPSFFRDQASVRQWVDGIMTEQTDWHTADLLARLAAETANTFTYAMREEEGVQTPSQTLQRRGGSCRDFATLFIESCRYLGLAARFVSGYLHAPELAFAAGSTHAWSEVYLPGQGWRGFDNTSGRLCGPDHIATAIARHPEMIPPVSGSFSGPAGTSSTLSVMVNVSELP
ncbi:transglutaminase family protein [Ruficoccus amylovorans]|uniref:Transglutaminase family protein n=1 Tax=Ruficoccus amylovorans TaxID=1804625 RepID=A0A842HCD8_9BACT|nr:transglutaminase family protein [Ruficoccus amylovorans]MBC2594155.1 transglutaminase family protein [Ruficoccus amylovorans]